MQFNLESKRNDVRMPSPAYMKKAQKRDDNWGDDSLKNLSVTPLAI